MIASGGGGTIRVFDVARGLSLPPFRATQQIESVRFSPDCRLIASCARRRSAANWGFGQPQGWTAVPPRFIDATAEKRHTSDSGAWPIRRTVVDRHFGRDGLIEVYRHLGDAAADSLSGRSETQGTPIGYCFLAPTGTAGHRPQGQQTAAGRFSDLGCFGHAARVLERFTRRRCWSVCFSRKIKWQSVLPDASRSIDTTVARPPRKSHCRRTGPPSKCI